MERRFPYWQSRSLRWWSLPVGIVVFLVALSTIPYHFPVSPNFSESYLFGYNNRVGMAIVALGLVLLAVFGPRLELQQPKPGKPLSRSTLRKALAISFVVSTVFYLLTRELNGFNESIYLIDRVHMLLDGRVPYRQFEFAYGALFLYLPAWIAKALHLSASDGYGIFFVLATVLGTWLLFRVISAIDEPAGKQRTIFLLFWYISTAALPSIGTNCSMLRFILPSFFGLVLYRQMERTPGPLILLLPIPMYAVLLAVSPEFGVAFALGIAAYLLLFGHLRIPANLIAFFVTLASMAALTWLAERLGVFTTLEVFRTGGLNFPIMPAPHMLLLYTFAGVAACYAGQRLRQRQPGALLMLIFVSAFSLAGALGRCDPFHTLMDPIGILIAASFLIASLPALRRVVLPVAIFVYAVFPLAVAVPYNGTNFVKAALPLYLAHEDSKQLTAFDHRIIAKMSRTMTPALAAEKFAALKYFAQHKGAIDVPALFGQPVSTVFAVPFGFAPSHFGPYHSPAIDEGYYSETINIATAAGIDRVIRELESHPERPLLMLPGRERNCSGDAATAQTYLRQTFLYPYSARVMHPESIGEPLCVYIQQHYSRAQAATPERFDYELWVRTKRPQEPK
jgi:hypothetical protein